MKTIASVLLLKRWRAELGSQGLKEVLLVPVFGAPHSQVLRLIEYSKKYSGVVVVASVGSAPFWDAIDPGQTKAVMEYLLEVEHLVLFTPEYHEFYPKNFSTQIEERHLREICEGEGSYENYIDGITSVTKFCNIVSPTRILLDQSDAKFCGVIDRIVEDLNLPVIVEHVPIVREVDGLNRCHLSGLLTRSERELAPALYRSFKLIEKLWNERDPSIPFDFAESTDKGIEFLEDQGFEVQFYECIDAKTLEPLSSYIVERNVKPLLVVSASLGLSKFLDNYELEPQEIKDKKNISA